MILSNCKVFLSLDKLIDLVDKIAALVREEGVAMGLKQVIEQRTPL